MISSNAIDVCPSSWDPLQKTITWKSHLGTILSKTLFDKKFDREIEIF